MGSSTESLKEPSFKIALLLFHFVKDFLFFLVWLDNTGILKGTAMQCIRSFLLYFRREGIWMLI